MTNATCFSRDELRSYLLGDMPESDSGSVARHIEACVDCEATIAGLDLESDTMIEAIRQPSEQQKKDPGSVYRLAAKRAVAQWQVAENVVDQSDYAGSALTRLRDYELLEPLARGGMAAVYRARHVRLNRQVALKVLPARWLQDPAVVARFEREMHAVGSLQHPAIIQATDGGEAEGVHFLVMELIDGCDGSAIVKQLGPLPIADACEIARQAAVGMAYVHDQGIIHRDLKPSNLMVTRLGETKVLDLGLARIVGDHLAEDDLTTVGQLMGTLDFMAPEQLENSHSVDERADIYSLGATLYKLLTGSSPHAMQAREPLVSKLRRIAADPPQALSERRSDVPAELCRLVDRMVSHDLNTRPASMQQVAELVAPFSETCDLARRVKEATRIRQQAQSAPSPSSLLATGNVVSATASTDSRSGSNNRFLSWAAAGLLALAAAMGVFITLQTTAGQLVIETATPEVEVRVLKAGQAYQQLTLKQKANTLRLGAGEYEIEIVSDADGLEIENGTYTLKRGETWLARIVHNKGRSDIQPATERKANQPTYEGKTLDEWLVLLRTERSKKQLVEACKALDKLATGNHVAEATAALVEAVRHHESGSYIWSTVSNLLASRDQAVVVAVLTKRLDNRDNADTEFILYYLKSRASSLQEHVDHQLLEHIERLSADQSPENRKRALGLLGKLASEGLATRVLLAALSDHDPDIQFSAARNLIEIESSIPVVASALMQLVATGELKHRAEAAWMLGDLGGAAKPAIPNLMAVVQSTDPALNRDVGFVPPIANGGMGGGGFNGELSGGMGGMGVSVRTAAIRALARIGGEAVVPMLLEEWQRLTTDVPGGGMGGGSQVMDRGLRNMSAKWLANSIEESIGLRPMREISRGAAFFTKWYAGKLSFSVVYRLAFGQKRGRQLPKFVDAQKLMARATVYEREEALHWVMSKDVKARTPGAAEIELEIKLIEILVASEGAQSTLPALLSRWEKYVQNDLDEWSNDDRATAMDAYRKLAARIVHGTEDWKTSIVPHLFHPNGMARSGPASIVAMDLVSALEPEQQLRGVVQLMSFISRVGSSGSGSAVEVAGRWLGESSNQDKIYELLRQEYSDEWEDLMIGLLRSGLSDEAMVEILRNRFIDDSIDRAGLLMKLFRLLDEQPDVAQLVIDLIKHPALDAPEPVVVDGKKQFVSSPRSALLYPTNWRGVPKQHRSQFRPLFEEFAESAVKNERASARNILDDWK